MAAAKPTATVEANFDGLVGPTHNYAGLSFGNLASTRNAAQPSNPREAALQGLAKMRALFDLGIPQAVLPPHERPHLPTLRRLGFSGTDEQVLDKVRRRAPALLASCGSASAMWTANAATVSPSADTADRRIHFTPANLCSHLHRSIETEVTGRLLKSVFPDPSHFVHHPPLPCNPHLGDEGAANHSRLCRDYGAPGLEMFVFGNAEGAGAAPARYPARQTRLASESIARLHELPRSGTLFAQQHPDAIDAGVFHNDVIAVANREVLLYHASAFVDAEGVRERVRKHFGKDGEPVFIEVGDDELSLADAVGSYLFNSQLVCDPKGRMHMVVARECQEQPASRAVLERIVADDANPIDQVHVLDLRQSMNNGGGPACLRLRVVLTPEEWAAVSPGVWFGVKRHAELAAWVDSHYRDHLDDDDLADPQLLEESRTALDRLTRLLKLGSVYDFQRD